MQTRTSVWPPGHFSAGTQRGCHQVGTGGIPLLLGALRFVESSSQPFCWLGLPCTLALAAGLWRVT